MRETRGCGARGGKSVVEAVKRNERPEQTVEWAINDRMPHADGPLFASNRHCNMKHRQLPDKIIIRLITCQLQTLVVCLLIYSRPRWSQFRNEDIVIVPLPLLVDRGWIFLTIFEGDNWIEPRFFFVSFLRKDKLLFDQIYIESSTGINCLLLHRNEKEILLSWAKNWRIF